MMSDAAGILTQERHFMLEAVLVQGESNMLREL
jgi:hypothetical protein